MRWTKHTWLTTMLIFAGAGCASSYGPTPELIEARRAYDHARMSRAADLAPDELHQAERALARAEAVHADNPQSEDERHVSYVAQRRAEKAATVGALRAADEARKATDKEYAQEQDRVRRIAEQKLAAREQELDQTEDELAETEGQLRDTKRELEKKDDTLALEQQARRSAQEQSKAAVETLEQVAKAEQERLKEERRKKVITLSGAVSFKTGNSELLPMGKQRLDEAAEAIKAEPAQRRITIVGHSDSTGSPTKNDQLSLARAQTVRDYLVLRGVDSHRISSIGKGSREPVADNDTPEGRAMNRRVEIIITDEPMG